MLFNNTYILNSKADPNFNVRYEFIHDGCPLDDPEIINVSENGSSDHVDFHLRAFTFKSENSEIYLHCSRVINNFFKTLTLERLSILKLSLILTT